MRPEVELLLSCAGRELTPAQINRLTQLARTPLNWVEVLSLARRHGVIALLCYHLSNYAAQTVPAGIMEQLLDLKTQHAWRSLNLTDELLRVLRCLKEDGIPALPYKGPVLGQLLYGDTTLRYFDDLDILVPLQDVMRAAATLTRCGYRQERPLTPRQARHILKYECELAFTHSEKVAHIDLHWNFAPRYFTLRLDLAGIWQRAQSTSMEGQAIATLAPEDALLMLAINAGKDFWVRLLPLCDLAELIKQTPQLDWPRLWHQATAANAQRMLGVSLSLAQDLLRVELPASAQQKLTEDRALPQLAAHAQSILLDKGLKELHPESYLLPARALPNRQTQLQFYLTFGLQPSWEDWSLIKFPAALDFLYYLTRPLRLARKYASANHKASY